MIFIVAPVINGRCFPLFHQRSDISRNLVVEIIIKIKQNANPFSIDVAERIVTRI